MQCLPPYASGSTVLDKGRNETEDAGRRLSQMRLYLSIYQFYHVSSLMHGTGLGEQPLLVREQ